MHWITSTLLAVTALAGVTAQAMTGGSVDATFRGTWVPASAACTSPLKLVIKAKRVTFVHGAQRAEYRQLEQCFTCMGRDVDDVTLLSTDAMGDFPFMLSLDASKKRPAVRTDFSTDKKLGARFPFGTAALKPSASPGFQERRRGGSAHVAWLSRCFSDPIMASPVSPISVDAHRCSRTR